MRWKLLRRRLTISAPRVAVRSAMPWPLRWAVVAIVLGFCAAISLWTFEVGKSIAGLETHAKEELVRLRQENARLREDRDKRREFDSLVKDLRFAADAARVDRRA